MTTKPEPQPAKSRKALDARAPKRTIGPKIKTSINMSVDAWQRLSIHATMMKMDRGELMEQLIRDHLKRYVVSDRGGLPSETTPLDE